MREIKFRAWHKQKKTIIGTIKSLLTGVGTYICRRVIETDPKKLNSLAKEKGEDFELYTNQDKLILMQYTGLKDKNGKEIYEGDIVKLGQLISEIVFDQGMFVVKDYEGYMILSNHETDEYDRFDDLEIIGNIHQNPELLG